LAAEAQNSSVPCESFVYDRSVFSNTLTMDLNLVCDDGEYKQRLLGTLVSRSATQCDKIWAKFASFFTILDATKPANDQIFYKLL
jgi:hypothetical protein